jgi:hypothetical protein
MVSDSEACHKQRDVIEFQMAEEETVGNIHKCLKYIYRDWLSIGAQLDARQNVWDRQKEGMPTWLISHIVANEK